MKNYINIIRLLFAISFVIIITLPVVLLILKVEVSKLEITERRILNQKPVFQSNNYKLLPNQYEDYLNDNIPFRTFFIANYMKIWEMKLSSFVRENIKGKNKHNFSKPFKSTYF